MMDCKGVANKMQINHLFLELGKFVTYLSLTSVTSSVFSLSLFPYLQNDVSPFNSLVLL